MQRITMTCARKCWAWLGFVLLAMASGRAQAKAPVCVEALGVHTDPQTQKRFVAVRLMVAEGWHVYWRNPGDSGQAPSLKFAPEDAAGAPLWPRPSRLQTPPLASYGYEHALVLAAPLQRDDTDVSAQVQWLACAETCVPGTATVMWPQSQLKRAGAQPDIARALVAVPQALGADWQSAASQNSNTVTLGLVAQSASQLDAISAVTFYPDAAGAVDENCPKVWGRDGARLTLSWTPGRAFNTQRTHIDGVVQLSGPTEAVRSFSVHAPVQAQALRAATAQGVVAPQNTGKACEAVDAAATWSHIVQAMLLAVVGGMVLNLMPCVFPVLSMKVLGLIQMGAASRAHRRTHALWYALGNVLSLTTIGAVLLGFRAMGQRVGWGFQMQSPVFVMAMAQLMFVMGLWQLGLVRFGERLMGIGQSQASGHSRRAAFFTGVLTVVVATPCSAPFVGVATGAALVAPTGLGLALFAAIGLGVALPYVALCYSESLAALMPRPGAWMVRLREATGLCLWGSSIWLLWIVGQQRGPGAMARGLVGALTFASAAWLEHGQRPTWPRRLLALALWGQGLAIALWPSASTQLPLRRSQERPAMSAGFAQGEAWQPYSAARLKSLRDAHQAVFVDFTAAWCVSCQVNEALVLDTPAARALLARHNVARLRADWTDQDADITQALLQWGRSSVPLYVLYPAGGESQPKVLPAVLRLSTLEDAIVKAEAP